MGKANKFQQEQNVVDNINKKKKNWKISILNVQNKYKQIWVHQIF